MLSELHYITVATLPHPMLDNLQKQVMTNDQIQMRILGREENRPIGWQSRGNFGIKLKKVYEFLQNPELSNDAIILFTDAYDVAYFGTQSNILSTYTSFAKPIVFGGEKHCNPDPHKKRDYPDTTSEFPYLNSGLFIGKVWALRQCMQGYAYNDAHDDQRYWTSKFLQHPDLITIDYGARMFLNTVDIDMKMFQVDNHRVRYRNYYPAFVHVNGPDKQMMNVFTDHSSNI